MEWSDRGPTDAPHGMKTTSEVLPTVSRPDGLLWPSMTSSGNDREKVPMFDPIGKGPICRLFMHFGWCNWGHAYDRPNAWWIPVGIQKPDGPTLVFHGMSFLCALISEQLL